MNFQFRSRQVGGCMCQHSFGNIQVIAAQQDFSHHVVFVPEVFLWLFNPQVIKTENNRRLAFSPRSKSSFTVSVNHPVSFFFKFKAKFAGGNNLVLFGWWAKIAGQFHQACFSRPYRPNQKDSFPVIQTKPADIFLIADGIHQQFVNQGIILRVNAKVISKQHLSLSFHPAHTGGKTKMVQTIFERCDFLKGAPNSLYHC